MRQYPYNSFRFQVEIEGIIHAFFSEVSGLQYQTETELYEEGGVNDYVHILPKKTKYQNITLKRGITDDHQLWEWHREVMSGHFKRKSGAIILVNDNNEPKWRWDFLHAFPVKWAGPEFKAESSAIAFESIELAHEGIHEIKKG